MGRGNPATFRLSFPLLHVMLEAFLFVSLILSCFGFWDFGILGFWVLGYIHSLQSIWRFLGQVPLERGCEVV